MGLDPIGYKPWAGKRSEHNRRFLVIADSILRQKLKAGWLLGLLIMGMFLVHVIPLIIYSVTPHQGLDAGFMRNYMSDSLFFVFDIIIVALICSDLFSEDFRSNSIVLYLSRALKAEGYLLGKWMGAMVTLCLFTLIPPMAVSIAIMATQSGGDYYQSLAVIGQTFLAGIWTALFLIPMGLLLSSITTKRTYAGVGIFMFFFVLGIVAMILNQFSQDWNLISPQFVLGSSYTVLYGLTLPGTVSIALMGAMILILTIPPIMLVYLRILRKGVGK